MARVPPSNDLRAPRCGRASPQPPVRSARRRQPDAGRPHRFGVQRAKRFLNETDLPLTMVAAQAGFGSLRRFNAVFAEVYGRPPSAIRRGRTPARR